MVLVAGSTSRSLTSLTPRWPAWGFCGSEWRLVEARSWGRLPRAVGMWRCQHRRLTPSAGESVSECHDFQSWRPTPRSVAQHQYCLTPLPVNSRRSSQARSLILPHRYPWNPAAIRERIPCSLLRQLSLSRPVTESATGWSMRIDLPRPNCCIRALGQGRLAHIRRWPRSPPLLLEVFSPMPAFVPDGGSRLAPGSPRRS